MDMRIDYFIFKIDIARQIGLLVRAMVSTTYLNNDQIAQAEDSARYVYLFRWELWSDSSETLQQINQQLK